MTDIDSPPAAEYVLGTLDLSERREFERRLALDPLLRAEVAEWHERLAPLTHSIEPIEPSLELWDRIDARLNQMEGGDNVVSINRAIVRRSIIRRPVAVGIFGAMAASIVGFGFVHGFDSYAPKSAPSAVQAIAPSASVSATGQPATMTATAVPCPSDPRNAVQTASRAQEPAAQRDASSGSVAVASASRGQGGIAIGGQIAETEQLRARPEGANNIATASAAEPDGNGAVTSASAAKPDSNGNVTIASTGNPGCK